MAQGRGLMGYVWSLAGKWWGWIWFRGCQRTTQERGRRQSEAVGVVKRFQASTRWHTPMHGRLGGLEQRPVSPVVTTDEWNTTQSRGAAP